MSTESKDHDLLIKFIHDNFKDFKYEESKELFLKKQWNPLKHSKEKTFQYSEKYIHPKLTLECLDLDDGCSEKKYYINNILYQDIFVDRKDYSSLFDFVIYMIDEEKKKNNPLRKKIIEGLNDN